MNKALPTLVLLAAALLPLSAAAQTGPGTAGECARARDPERCAALQQAKELCRDKSTAEKRDCMQNAMPPADCSKSRQPARCEAHQKAKELCKDKVGQDRRQCMRDNTPKAKGAKQKARKKAAKAQNKKARRS